MSIMFNGKKLERIIFNGVDVYAADYKVANGIATPVFARDPNWTPYKVDFFGDNSGVAMYRFENDFNDLNNVYNGVATGMVLDTTETKFPKCASFTGGGKLMISNINASLYTIAFWIKATSLPVRDNFIIGIANGIGITAANANGNNFSFHRPGLVELNNNNPAGNPINGAWNFVCLTVNNLTVNTINMKWYVNSILSASTAVSGGGGMLPMDRLSLNPTGLFTGKMKNLRVFNRALTQSEINTLFLEDNAA